MPEYTQVRSAAWVEPDDDDEGRGSASGCWEISLDDDTDCRAERIWLATGSQQGVDTDPLLKQLLEAHPIAVHNGFPEVLPTLRWAPDVTLYVMGGLAVGRDGA